jgi:hypothetical protein
MIMAKYKTNIRKLVFNWLAISIIFGVVVYPMTLLMPLNKALYSSSFTLIVIAVSGACLTAIYFLVDILPTKAPCSKKVV